MDRTDSPPPVHPYRFIPVPRCSGRADGWTSDRQHAFVWALARMPSVAAAARSVGMTAGSAYRLRRAPGAEAFAQAWDDAWEIGMLTLHDLSIERAMKGEEVPIVRRGQVVGKVHRYNTPLMIRTLAYADRLAGRPIPQQRRAGKGA